MDNDETLLRKYVGEGSEAAFSELVNRYAGQVFSVARRQTGDYELAKDVTQSVFILLARKAKTLCPHVVLAAWLFRATQLVVAGMRKHAGRRYQRERKVAAMMSTESKPETGPDWDKIQPHLDDSIARLGETERAALLLSFFHKLSHKETGQRLGLSEEAVRKRIHRALEKMRAYFQRRGVAVSGDLLLALLMAHSVEGAPAEISAATCAAAAQGGSGAAEPVARLAEEAGRSMDWMSLKPVLSGVAGGLCALALAGWWLGSEPDGLRYSGMSDASAAVWVAPGLFLAADDEVNHFNLYSLAQPGKPLQSFDFSTLLKLDREQDETDWEGATRMGDRAYWITSHGQNRRGKNRPSRHRLMALDISWRDSRLELIPFGQPYTELLADLKNQADYRVFGLAEAATRAPKASQALNIEGLCATPEGHLLIGFRNPVPQGKALIARMSNPEEVVQGQHARFEPPVLLDLGGLGVRDFTRVDDVYYIIAGPVTEKGRFEVYEWRANAGPPMRCDGFHFGGLKPEAMLIERQEGADWAVFLSDDGTLTRFGRMMKKAPVENRWFRAMRVPLDNPVLSTH